MKNKKKKYLGFVTAVFIVALIISSTTAVPVANNKAVEDIEENLEEQIEDNIENFVFDKFMQMSGQLDQNLKTYLMEVFNNAEFRTKFDQAKSSIITKIEEEFTEDQVETVKQLFDIDETFSLDALESRINSVNPDTVLDDVQKKLKIAEDSEELEENFFDETSTFLELLYERDGKPDPESEGLRVVSNFICDSISKILEILILILAPILGEDLGILAAVLIYCNCLVFIFSPVILFIILWDACLDAIFYEPGLRQQLNDIWEEHGVIGIAAFGPPVVFIWTIIEWYLFQSILDTGKVLFLQDFVIESDGSVTIIYGQEAPRSRGFTLEHDYGPVYRYYFSATVEDNDKVNTGEFRDAVQVGWNWTGKVGDNPLTVDKWTPLGYSREITTEHVFSKSGTYEVRYMSRDQWGAILVEEGSDPWSQPVTVFANKAPDKPALTGPTQLDRFEEGIFEAVTTDLEGNQIYYKFIQDGFPLTGWEGPYNSGDTVTFKKSWTKEDKYTINVIAKDSNNLQSSLSNSITVKIGDGGTIRSKSIFMFDSFLEKFPMLSKIFFLLELFK